MPRRALWRRLCVGCGEEVVIPLGALNPVECTACGLDYNPRTGEALPVLTAGDAGPGPKSTVRRADLEFTMALSA